MELGYHEMGKTEKPLEKDPCGQEPRLAAFSWAELPVDSQPCAEPSWKWILWHPVQPSGLVPSGTEISVLVEPCPKDRFVS